MDRRAIATGGLRPLGGRTRLSVATDGYRGTAPLGDLLPTLVEVSVVARQVVALVGAALVLPQLDSGEALAQLQAQMAAVEIVGTEAQVAVVAREARCEVNNGLAEVAVAGAQVVALDLSTVVIEIEGDGDMAYCSSSVREWAAKIGDTRYLKATLKEKAIGAEDSDATEINLTGASVSFTHQPEAGGDEVTETVEITNASAGQVQVEWAEGSLDTAGQRRGVFVVTLASGEVLTAPTAGFIQLSVVDTYEEVSLGC